MYVISPSKSPRTANTVRLHVLMEEQQRLGIATRITALRERSRFTQPQIAEKLGLTLRGYQKLEEKGTTKYERCEEIAEIHGVSADWIWDGRERGETPDPFATPSAGTDDATLAAIRSLRTELLAEIGKVQKAQEALRKQTAPSPRSRAAKDK